MALANTNSNWVNGTYEDDRNEEIKRSENDGLRLYGQPLGIHIIDGNMTIGYGWDLSQHTAAETAAILNGHLSGGGQVEPAIV